MFGRRRRDRGGETAHGPEPSADGPRHAELPALSVEQAAALHQLVLAALSARGLPADTTGDGVVHSDTMQYGLHNLSLVVADRPWPDWAELVDRHVAAVAGTAGSTDTPPRSEQRLLKLRDEHDLACDPVFVDASPFPGLIVLPAVDYPTHVHEMGRVGDLDELGGWDAWRQTAMANLRRLPPPEHHVLPADPERDDAELQILVTEDFFGASRALVLDHVLSSVLGVERPTYGCLVAVPNRHLLVIHLPSGAGLLSALEAMIRMAAGECRDRPGPISPHVFFAPPGGGAIQRVSHRDEEPGGEIRIVVEGAFAEAVTSLGLLNGE